MKYSSPTQIFSPNGLRAPVETNRIPYSSSAYNLFDLKASPGRRYSGGVTAFASPKYQSWGELKKEIRSTVSSKVQNYEAGKSFIKRKEFGLGVLEDTYKPQPLKKPDHRLLIQGLFTSTPTDKKKLDFDLIL
jgi:hypothetical protein